MLLTSAGCKTCKVRRIKCDGAFPICNNCTKSKKSRTCTGTVAPHSIVHVENKYASGEKKRPRGPRSTSKVNAIIVQNTESLSSTDIRTQAIAYFIHDHLPTPDDGPGILRGLYSDFLPHWMTRMNCPLLNQALTAVALVAFSHARHQPLVISIAAMEYESLLKNMRTKLASLDESVIDVSLIANFFMGRFEDMIHQRNRSDSSQLMSRSIPHHDGALAIMKAWKETFSQDRPASSVIKHSRRGLIRSALLRNHALPDWLLDGRCFGEEGSDLEYYRIFSQLTNIRHEILTYLERLPMTPSPCEEFAKRIDHLRLDILDLDTALQAWVTSFPTTWSYLERELDDGHPWCTAGPRLLKVNIFTDVAYASAWNHYFATRMLIQDTRIKALQLVQIGDDFTDEYSQCTACLECMARNLAASLPYALRKMQPLPHSRDLISFCDQNVSPKVASLAVWPLTIAVGLVELSPELEILFRAELKSLGRIIGSPVIEEFSQSARSA